jgi:hypothetical protein
MEKYLSELINNKHLIYIIQEYSREKYTFLEEYNKNIHVQNVSKSDYTLNHIWNYKYYSKGKQIIKWMLHNIIIN